MLEVTVCLNRGILLYLKAKGRESLSDWIDQVSTVFQLKFVTTTETITVSGPFFHIRAFDDYLNNTFPKGIHKTVGNYDEPIKIKGRGQNAELRKFDLDVSNSKDGIVYQYQRNGVLLSIYEADITDISVDCIVSSASQFLSGKMGIEKAIMDAAGDEVRKECSKYIGTRTVLKSGCVLVTQGGRLKCKNIIHCLLKCGEDRKVQDAVLKCFHETEKQNLHSVAIPAIGSGNLT